MKKSIKYDYVYPIIVMALWGSLYTCISLTYKYIGVDKTSVPDIFVFAGIRFTICGALMTLISIIRGDWKKTFEGTTTKTKWSVWGILLAVSLLYIVVQYVFTYLGSGMVGSANTALIKQIASVVFIPLSFLFFKEDRFSWGKVVGAVLGMLAIIALNLGKGNLLSMGMGQLFLIISAMGVLIGNIITKLNLKQIRPFVLTGVTELLGGVIMLVVGLLIHGQMPSFKEAGTDVISVRGILVFGYIVVATLLSYGIWYTSMEKANLSGLYIVKLSEPLFTAIFAAIIAGEAGTVLRPGFFIAMVILVLAVLVANLWDKLFKKKAKVSE